MLKWTAPLIGIRDVVKGQSVGYGQTWVADKPTRVGLVPIGYADGYDRANSNRGVMLVHDCPRPRDRPGQHGPSPPSTCRKCPMTALGDTVTVLDSDPLSIASVYRLAEWSNTIPYEIFCRIAPAFGESRSIPPTVRKSSPWPTRKNGTKQKRPRFAPYNFSRSGERPPGILFSSTSNLGP